MSEKCQQAKRYKTTQTTLKKKKEVKDRQLLSQRDTHIHTQAHTDEHVNTKREEALHAGQNEVKWISTSQDLTGQL